MKASPHYGSDLRLVLSNEFNNGGRKIDPGDAFWEAPSMHCLQTANLEWCKAAVVTAEAFKITRRTDKSKYEGGTAYRWNRSFFMGGRVEVSMPLPSLSGIAEPQL